MAQLYYKYGTMNSGKTIEILKVAHNYEEQGKSVVIMTSAVDTRDGFGVVSSRIGTSCFWLIRLTKSKQFANIALKKQPWFCGRIMGNLSMMANRSKSVAMRPIFLFAASIISIHPLNRMN